MNKKGFTLVELMAVLIIVSVVSVSSIITFGQINKDTSKNELANTYKEIQRSAVLYLDLNDVWLNSFVSEKKIDIKLFELKNWNYVSDEIKDSINNKEISDNYIVRIYVSGEGKNIYTNTCIYENKMVNNVQRSVCIADETGKYDFDDNSIVGDACCKEGA